MGIISFHPLVLWMRKLRQGLRRTWSPAPCHDPWCGLFHTQVAQMAPFEGCQVLLKIGGK